MRSPRLQGAIERTLWIERIGQRGVVFMWCSTRDQLGAVGSSSMFVIAAASLSALLCVLIWRAAVGVPFQDELTFGTLFHQIARFGFPSLTEILAAHNGHPYALLKLLIAVTLGLGLPWTWMMYAQALILMVCTLTVLTRVDHSGGWSRTLSAAALILLILTPRQWENLYWSMQLVFPVFLVSSLTAFGYVSRFAADGRSPFLFAALAFALIASLANGAGIFTLLLTGGTLIALRRRGKDALVVLLAVSTGAALFMVSQVLAPRSGVGSGSLPLLRSAEHILRMFAHTYADFGGWRLLSILVGCASLGLTLYCATRALKEWPSSAFELLCIALGMVLILGVTYSRVSAGHFQPDAPRYLPLLAPVGIGCLLLLNRWRNTLALGVLVALILSGYLVSLRAEWHLSPYRHANMWEAHKWLCLDGAVHPAHNLRITLSPDAVRDLQSLFCDWGGKSVVDHASIENSGASGFYREQQQTWIQPRLALRVPNESIDGLVLSGWLPDTVNYPDGEFHVQVLANGAPVRSFQVKSVGQFSEFISFPRGARSITVNASARNKVGADERDLSWVLVSVQFVRSERVTR